MIGTCHSAAPLGVSARFVEVEVDVQEATRHGLAFVGLPDAGVREAVNRVKAALSNARFRFPSSHRVVINLAPANLRKEGPAYDLPIALAVLAATRQVRAPRLDDHLVVGELSLDGRVRPVRGVLCMADRAARSRRWKGILVPAENAREAALARGLPVVPVETLVEAVLFLAGAREGRAVVPSPEGGPAAVPSPPGPDFADVRGQEGAVRAALVAAAGGHNLLLVGPPGCGKTMIAERLAGILPPLDEAGSIEATKIHSVAGLLRGDPLTTPPFRAPHHTTSAAGLLGGGPRASPGEITLAHRGVLFLDELPEFDRRSLEGLREPLERGELCVVRAGYRVRFPSRFLLAAAMNPCPCGNHGVPDRACACTPPAVVRYRGRVSGPLLDRFDLQVRVPPVRAGDLAVEARRGPSSASLRAAVAAARALQGARGVPNAALDGKALDRFAAPAREGAAFLERASDRLRLSARAVVRVRRLARTLADLEGAEAVRREHLAEAVSFRVKEGE